MIRHRATALAFEDSCIANQSANFQASLSFPMPELYVLIFLIPWRLHVSTVKIITSSHLNGSGSIPKYAFVLYFVISMFIFADLLTNGQKGMLMFTHWAAFFS
jgi:hypothetical protein